MVKFVKHASAIEPALPVRVHWHVISRNTPVLNLFTPVATLQVGQGTMTLAQRLSQVGVGAVEIIVARMHPHTHT